MMFVISSVLFLSDLAYLLLTVIGKGKRPSLKVSAVLLLTALAFLIGGII